MKHSHLDTRLVHVLLFATLLTLGACAGEDPNGPRADFTLQATSLWVRAGAGGVFEVSVAGTDVTGEPVTVTLSGGPAGMTTDPALPISVAPGSSRLITVRIPHEAEAGDYTLTVQGSGGEITKTASATLTVSPAGPAPLALEVVRSVEAPCAHGVTVAGGDVFVTGVCDSLLRVVPRGGAVATTAGQVGDSPVRVAASPSGRTLYVANAEGSISVVDALLRRTEATIVLPRDAEHRLPEVHNVIVSPDGSRLFVATARDGVIAVEVATRQAVGTASIGARTIGLAFDPTGRTLYVSSDAGEVVVLNAATLAEERRYAVAGDLHQIAVSPDGRTLYAASEYDVGFAALDLATGAVTWVDIGRAGFALVVRPEGDYAYVARVARGFSCDIPGDVTVIDLATLSVRAVIPAGHDPRGIALAPDGTVYVADQTGALHVIVGAP